MATASTTLTKEQLLQARIYRFPFGSITEKAKACWFANVSQKRRAVRLKLNTMRARDSIVYTPVSLGPDTDDEETLVNAEVYNNGEL
ncbi:hypothetical protein WN48_03033 [Eufriesea mexicana]|uniref:Uncharacterized protein n=1 Tax=Eufriesea mexicana TaxID=516756 RepID=A0A310SEM5_9HYME|nr:hypothetical protein WN48_03033 [Eufriesea mexicana]